MNALVGQLQGNHARDDQSDTEVFGDRCRITVVEDPHCERPGSADAGPNGIGRANRDSALSQPKQESADGHKDDSDENADLAILRLLSHLETDGPTDFKQAR